MSWRHRRCGLEVTACIHTRLGLSFADAVGSPDHPAARLIRTGLITRAIHSRDGYVARDVLADNGCVQILTSTQRQTLTDRVNACALGCGDLPPALQAELLTALNSAEAVIRA